jgi:hypothetical protein
MHAYEFKLEVERDGGMGSDKKLWHNMMPLESLCFLRKK